MTTEISDYVQVPKRLDELSCSYSGGVAMLPVNFETATSTENLSHYSETPTIKKLFRGSNIPYTEIRKENEKPSYIQNNAFKWIGPMLFFSTALMLDNPQIISVSLGVIANYLTGFFKGFSGEKTAKLDIVVENKSKTYTKISYEGHIDGISSLAEVVRRVSNE